MINPALFTPIGAALLISNISPNTIVFAIIVLPVSAGIKWLAGFAMAPFGNKYENLFTAICFLPKAAI